MIHNSEAQTHMYFLTLFCELSGAILSQGVLCINWVGFKLQVRLCSTLLVHSEVQTEGTTVTGGHAAFMVPTETQKASQSSHAHVNTLFMAHSLIFHQLKQVIWPHPTLVVSGILSVTLMEGTKSLGEKNKSLNARRK